MFDCVVNVVILKWLINMAMVTLITKQHLRGEGGSGGDLRRWRVEVVCKGGDGDES